MYCKKCGAELKSPYIYCPKCFQPVEDLAVEQNFHSYPMPKNIYQTPQNPLNKHNNKDLNDYPTPQNPFNTHLGNIEENFINTNNSIKEKDIKKSSKNRTSKKSLKKGYMGNDYSNSPNAVKITFPLIFTICSILLGNIVLGLIALFYVPQISRYNVFGNFIKAKQVKSKVIKYDIIGTVISGVVFIALNIMGVIKLG